MALQDGECCRICHAVWHICLTRYEPMIQTDRWQAPVRGCLMLKASPSSSAPGVWMGAAGMSLFCMLRMRPALTASRKGSRSCCGTCSGSTLPQHKWPAVSSCTTRMQPALMASRKYCRSCCGTCSGNLPPQYHPQQPQSATAQAAQQDDCMVSSIRRDLCILQGEVSAGDPV